MLYYSIDSRGKMVHFADCPRAKLIKDDNRRSFRDIHEAHQYGYSMCPCCSPVLKKFRTEKATLIDFSQKNGLAFFLIGDVLHIHTTYSEWKIVPWDNHHKLRFYHENVIYKKSKKRGVSDYHRQKFGADTLLEYLHYIASHEEYRLSIAEQPSKKGKAPKGSRKKHRKARNISRRQRNRKAWQVIHLIDAVCENSHCLQM